MTEARDPEKLRGKLIQYAKDFPFFKLLGFEVLDVKPLWSKCQVTFRPDLVNPAGVLHGGVIATLIDAGITNAMLMTDEYQVIRQSKGHMSTVDLGIKYLRPCFGGVLICESNIVHLGKRILHAQSVVNDQDGQQIALGDATMMMVPGKA